MCTKFDILNHDGFLVSRGCISVKFWRFRYILPIAENLHSLKHWNFAQCFKTWIQLYLQSLVTQFFPTSPNQIYYVTKLEALYTRAINWHAAMINFMYAGLMLISSSKLLTLDCLRVLMYLRITSDRTRRLLSNFPSSGWLLRASVMGSSLRNLMW